MSKCLRAGAAWLPTLICVLSAAAAPLNVQDFGAVGDARTDCTAAFQSALDEAGKTGATVTVPPGQYRLDGTLSIPDGVTLAGSWPGPHFPILARGSTLLAYAGRDDEAAAPFIVLNTSSTLKGLTVYYPQQHPRDIHPYPWTVQGRGSRYNILDMTFANSYNGIDCGTYGNEGHHLKNVHLCALRRGVYIDRTTDIGRVEDVHVHTVNWWRINYPEAMAAEDIAALNAYTTEHLEGFIIGRCDWEYLINCFVIWQKVGFRFVETLPAPDGTRHLQGMANILITQSGADIGPLAVKVEKVQGHAGIAFENCQFMSGFEIDAGNQGPVKLTNCGFWGNSGTGAHLVNRGRGTVQVSACHFSMACEAPGYQWDPSTPLIQCYGGALLMQGCLFQDYGHDPEVHVLLADQARAAALVGNRVKNGTLQVRNTCAADVQMVGNLGR